MVGKSEPEMTTARQGIHIPHGFPFRLVDICFVDAEATTGSKAESERRVRLRLTNAAAAQRGRPEFPAILALEILAQAALVLSLDRQRGDSRPARETAGTGGARLAGYDSVMFSESLAIRPLMAGDELEIRVETVARFGPMEKATGEIFRQGESVIEAEMLLAQG